MSWSRSTSRRSTTSQENDGPSGKVPPRRSGSSCDGPKSFGICGQIASISDGASRVPIAGRRRSSSQRETTPGKVAAEGSSRQINLQSGTTTGRLEDAAQPLIRQGRRQSRDESFSAQDDPTARLLNLSLSGGSAPQSRQQDAKAPSTVSDIKPPVAGQRISSANTVTKARRNSVGASASQRRQQDAKAPSAVSDTKPHIARQRVSSANTVTKARRDSVGAISGDARGPKVLGEAIKIPHPKGGNMDVIAYAPSTGKAIGITVVTPGSSGGFGPSIEHQHRGLPLSQQGSFATRGSLYARLGLELSTGMPFDWGNRQVGQGSGGGSVDESGSFVVTLQMTWRKSEDGVKWPAGKLRHLESLSASAGDICEVVQWAINRYGNLPVVLSGFSFGGPSVLAAARMLGSQRIAGVIALSGSARGGSRFVAAGLDTLGAVEELLKQRVPLLFLHGTRDSNVAIEIPIYLTQTATYAVEDHGPVTLGILRGSKHQLDAARDTVYPIFRRFVLECLERHAGAMGLAGGLPGGDYKVKRLKFVADEDKKRLRKDHILDLPELPQVQIEQLQDSSTKGYSE